MDLSSVPLAQSHQGGWGNSGSHQKLSKPSAKRQKEILSIYHQKPSVPTCDQGKALCTKRQVILQNIQSPMSPENLSGYTSCFDLCIWVPLSSVLVLCSSSSLLQLVGWNDPTPGIFTNWLHICAWILGL